MKTTIRDVARKAGVSIGTVSRVLNGHAAVSESSRSRVDTVVRSLNYYPLRKRRSPQGGNILNGKRVAFFILGFDRSLSSSPVVAEVIHGVEAGSPKGGATVELVDLPRLDQLPVVLKQDYLDGSILFGALQGNLVEAAKPVLIKRLSALPSVWIMRRPNFCWGDSVGPNDWLIGKMVHEHLLSKGHSRIAFLNPRREQITWQLRGISLCTTRKSPARKSKAIWEMTAQMRPIRFVATTMCRRSTNWLKKCWPSLHVPQLFLRRQIASPYMCIELCQCGVLRWVKILV